MMILLIYIAFISIFAFILYQNNRDIKELEKTIKDKNRILRFVDDVTKDSLIDYEQTIKKDILEIKTSSFFISTHIVYNFKILDDEVQFYSSNKIYEVANEKLFFDEMLSQCQNEKQK